MTQVIILVYRILGAKEQQPPLSPFFNGDLTQTSWRWERQIDQMVYKLYDLTPCP